MNTIRKAKKNKKAPLPDDNPEEAAKINLI